MTTCDCDNVHVQTRLHKPVWTAYDVCLHANTCCPARPPFPAENLCSRGWQTLPAEQGGWKSDATEGIGRITQIYKINSIANLCMLHTHVRPGWHAGTCQQRLSKLVQRLVASRHLGGREDSKGGRISPLDKACNE